MRIAATIARYLLGIVFVVFGMNGFLHFLPMGPIPPGPATEFFGAVTASHYMVPVFLVQVAGGILLLANRFVPLGLTLLGPVIFNIFLFHLLMAPAGLPLAILVLILWLLVFYSVRPAFSGIFRARPQS